MPPPPPSPIHAWWSEAQRLRLAGACIYASASLAVSAAALVALATAMASVLASRATPAAIARALASALWSPLHPRFAFYVLAMAAAQSLATAAAGKAARACAPSESLLTRGASRASKSRRATTPTTLTRLASTALVASSSAASRLALDGAASARAAATLVVACSLAGWAIVPLFCSLVSSSLSSSPSPSSPSPPSLPPAPLVSVPSWAPTLGLCVGAAHALVALALGEDVVVVASSPVRRARAFEVKRAAAESAGRAAATAAATSVALFAASALGGGGGGGGAGLAADDKAPAPVSSLFSSLSSSLAAVAGAALASHALLVGGASVRAAFAERTRFDAGVVSGARSGASGASDAATANDGLVASIVAAREAEGAAKATASPLEASLFDLSVRADAAALAEATPGSSWAWRRGALFADGVGRRGGGAAADVVVVGGGSFPSSSGGGEVRIPAAFPGRAWSAVVGGLCLAELGPALAAVGDALTATAATSLPASTSGRGQGSGTPPRWNRRPTAAGGAGAGDAVAGLAKGVASLAAGLLSSKPPATLDKPAPPPPAVLRARAASLLRRRWQHLSLALRTLGALAAAAADEDAAGVAQLAGGRSGRSGGTSDDGEGSDPFLPSFSCRGTDLGSVLSALLAAAIAFGAAAEPGALPPLDGGAAPSPPLPCCAPPGLRTLATALEGDGATTVSSSLGRAGADRDPAAVALADAALGAAHRAVAAYGKDAAGAVAKAVVPASAWASSKASPAGAAGSEAGGGRGLVTDSAVSALIEAVLSGRD